MFPIYYLDRQQVKKFALIALSTIMALGMIFSYVAGAPWWMIFLFFVCTLAPLCPVNDLVNEQRRRILEKPFTISEL